MQHSILFKATDRGHAFPASSFITASDSILQYILFHLQEGRLSHQLIALSSATPSLMPPHSEGLPTLPLDIRFAMSWSRRCRLHVIAADVYFSRRDFTSVTYARRRREFVA